ncbi:unnamed protein product [Didymodactylos carnosus]|uniref:Pyrrolo-quinoline quinone repeat domain-containing protein n=1 Tax=Didymodactylos carnosus TaxID=1234261 RepID=A0A814H176_9BILA|nr:unnamed protein product [Didymodactylos carnosus]CAF1004536.1 unnamed protein product [Didymodactylos carnosus]CAF3773723.1 unnamed protein product [Didymodactylos carnosus]CAF3775494.1 unnamed protein product [Didymodactylos carnosus]
MIILKTMISLVTLSILLFGQSIVASRSFQWPTFGGSPAHTGFIPINLNIESTTDQVTDPKLVWTGNLTRGLSYSTLFADTLLVTGSSRLTGDSKLFVLNALTGKVIHTIDLHAASYTGPPVGGFEYMAYVQSVGDLQGIYLQAINLITGDIKWTARGGAQWPSYPYGATPGLNYIYMAGGTYNGQLFAVDPYNGTIVFNTGVVVSSFSCDWWTPTVYNNRVFYNSQPGQGSNGVFGEANPDTGAVLWSVPLNSEWDGYSTYWVPAIMNDIALVSTRRTYGSIEFHAIGLNSHDILWSYSCPKASVIVNGSFKDFSPSTDGISAYFTCADGIHQVRTKSGQLVKIFSCENCAGQPIVTKDFLIISSDGNGTMIFNRKSGAISMHFEESGNLALHSSAKMLYITNSVTGTVFAYAI